LPLQHTATHCNTLQRTATHCNTLQETATHMQTPHVGTESYKKRPLCRCNTLQHTATHCNTLQHTTTHCNTYADPTCWYRELQEEASLPLQHTATHCNTLQHIATHCNALQHICRPHMLGQRAMGWLQVVGSLKLWVSFAECSLFYRALLQKRPKFLRSLPIVATPY